MAIDFKNLLSLADFTGRLGDYGKNKPPLAAPAKPAIPQRTPEEQQMFDLKAHLLDQARVTATERGEAFSLEHYRKECEAFAATEQGQQMEADGKWKPAIYADLSGQNLTGIHLSDPKAATKSGHSLSAETQALYGNAIEARKQVADTGLAANAENTAMKQARHDLLDLDCNGKIDPVPICQFYDEIRLEGATLRDAFIEPATSFNEEVAKAKHLERMTFRGMTEGDTFTFGAKGRYTDIRLENVNGGHIQFNGSVDGVTISGKQATIAIGEHARVNDIETEPGFSILKLHMSADAMLSNSDLRESTISMASEFEPGAIIQNVKFGRNVNGLDLRGVDLRNVSFNGVPITSREQLEDLGVKVNEKTKISASQEFILQTTAEKALQAGVQDFSYTAAKAQPMQQVAALQEAAPPAYEPAPASSTAIAEAAPAPLDPVAAAGATLRAQMDTIGQKLTEQEQANLLALNEAREQQQAAVSLPRRG